MTVVAQDAAFLARDERFADVLGATPSLEVVAAVDAHEGPVYVAEEDALYFTSIRTSSVSIRRLHLPTGDVSTLVEDANFANGMTLGRDGRLLVCEQGSHTTPARITRIDRTTGERATVLDNVYGVPLSSPNDVVVDMRGSIWFTDPSYGYIQGFRPAPSLPDRVYRVDPDGSVAVAASGFDKPNGLALSLDQRVLYVSDNGEPQHLLAYDVAADGSLRGRRVLAESTPEHPDGLAVDTNDRIYASASTGILVLAPTGELLGEIALPGAVNFTFGGTSGTTLFITTDTAVWAAELNAKGA